MGRGGGGGRLGLARRQPVLVADAAAAAGVVDGGQPGAALARKGNVLLLLFCSNGASIDEEGVRAARGELGAADGRRVWISRSYDRGRRWEPPREITADVKREGWTWYATGPGGAVELEDGTIVVPATHAVAGETGAGAPGYGVTDRSHLLLSDDQGKSWRLGAEGLLGSNEAAVAQLSDGRLLLNARDLTAARQRALHYSADGGATFSHADRHPSLPEPPPRGCHAAMVAAGPALFLTALDSPRARERLIRSAARTTAARAGTTSSCCGRARLPTRRCACFPARAAPTLRQRRRRAPSPLACSRARRCRRLLRRTHRLPARHRLLITLKSPTEGAPPRLAPPTNPTPCDRPTHNSV